MKICFTSRVLKLLLLLSVVFFLTQNNIVKAEIMSNNSNELPILETLPANGSDVIRPDTQIKISIDPTSKTYNRFRNQFEKGSFVIELNGQKVEAIYDEYLKVININSEILERYTEYNVEIKLKAESKNNNTNSNNASYKFSFKTGSALYEATHLYSEVLNSPVTVNEKGLISVNVTDDYGLPANNALIEVSSSSDNVSFNHINTTQSGNGNGIIEVTNHVKEIVGIKITAKDKKYNDDCDINTSEHSIQFNAGSSHDISLEGAETVKVNQTAIITATITDCYENLVEDGTPVSATCTSGTISETQQTVDGRVEFIYTPDTVGMVQVNISSNSASKSMNINVVSNGPTITLSTEDDEITVTDFVTTVSDSVYSNVGINSLTYQLNGEDDVYLEVTDGIWQIENLRLCAGNNEIKIKATDTEGNVSEKLIKIIFDLGVTAKITPEDIVNSKTMSYVKNQVLITFKEYVTVDEINEVISSINGRIVGYINWTNDYQVNIDNELSEDELITLVEELNQNSLVDVASINLIQHISFTTDDYGSQEYWDEENPAGKNFHLEFTNVPSAWDKLKENNDLTKNLKIGVLDQDIIDHVDIDYKYLAPPPLIGPQLPKEIYHGTFVAGVLGATTDNGIGAAGVAWNPDIFSYNVDLMDTFDIKFGLADLVSRGVRIINCSFGSGLKEEIQKHLISLYITDFNTRVNTARLNGKVLTREDISRIMNDLAEKIAQEARNSFPEQAIIAPKIDLKTSDSEEQIKTKEDNFNLGLSEMYSNISRRIIIRVLSNESISGSFSSYEDPVKVVTAQSKLLQASNSKFVKKLNEKGFDFLIVQAAGNAGIDFKGYANFFYNEPNAAASEKISLLTVGSVNNWAYIPGTSYIINPVISDFSNFGNWVDVYAPGKDIYSLHESNNYKISSGTSYSSPLVAGICGLVLKANRDLKASQIAQIIIDSCIDHGSFKRVDALKAVKKAYETETSGDIIIPNRGVIMEKVTREAGDAPISGATITVRKLRPYSTNTYDQTGISTITDAEGYYDFILDDGSYMFTITASGYVTENLYARVDNSATKQNPRLRLQTTPSSSGVGTSKGKVINALTGLPVPGASIEIFPGINTIGEAGIMIDPMTAKIQSLENGNFEAELPVGNYTGFVKINGYTSGFFYLYTTEDTIHTEQNCVITPIISEGQTRIVLTWDEVPRDLDSHLTGPTSIGGRFHVYYSNKKHIEDGVEMANLDLDDTSSFGPETVTVINQQLEGVYRYSVHDYTNRTSSTSNALSKSGAQVKVYRGDFLIALFYIPVDQVGNLWTVFEMDGNKIVPINTITFQSSPSSVQ